MKVLALMPSWPWPLDDGIRLRAFNFLRAVASRHEVRLCCLGPVDADGGVRDMVKGCDVVQPPRAVLRGGRDRRWQAFRLGHVWPNCPEMRQAVAGAMEQFRPDAVWATHLRIAEYIPETMAARTVLDLIDDQVLRCVDGPEAWFTRTKRALDFWIREFQAARRCGSAVFTSRADASTFGKVCPWRRSVVIPNGVDLLEDGSCGDPVSRPYVLFVGNFGFVPNAVGAALLAKRICPILRQIAPGLEVVLVGPNMSDEAKQACGAAGIRVTGWVPSVRPYLKGCKVVLSPLTSGHGIKNKVLEAWAASKPVVAMSHGLAGLEEYAGQAAIVARTVEEFAAAVVRLVDNHDLAASMGSAGRKIVEDTFSWHKCSSDLTLEIERVAGR